MVTYGLLLALLYGQENPVTFVGSLLKSVKEGLFGRSGGEK